MGQVGFSPGGLKMVWMKHEAVTPGVDDRFTGLGLGESVRDYRHRRGVTAGGWSRREAARTCAALRPERRRERSSISTSVARVVRAAVRGASS